MKYRPFIFPVLFVLASLFSLIFWLFLSDYEGHSNSVEKQIAEFVNSTYKKGDTVFSIPGWDIGYTKYLSDNIKSISHDIADYSADELGEFESDRFIFVLDNKNKWNSLALKYDVSEILSKTFGKSVVILAKNKRETVVPKLDFVKNMEKAKEAYLLDEKGVKENCILTSPIKWSCSKRDSWNSFEKMVGQMGGAARKSVWAHPRNRQKKRIVYSVPVNSSKMVLRTAFLPTAYSVKGDPVKVTVFADNRQILEYVNENISKMYIHEFSLPPNTAEVAIQVYTERDGARHFVFNGYIQ